MSHFIERWECGHVASQCRCPGPKADRVRPGKCQACSSMTPDTERDRLVAAVWAAIDERDDLYKQYLWAADSKIDATRRLLAAYDKEHPHG